MEWLDLGNMLCDLWWWQSEWLQNWVSTSRQRRHSLHRRRQDYKILQHWVMPRFIISEYFSSALIYTCELLAITQLHIPFHRKFGWQRRRQVQTKSRITGETEISWPSEQRFVYYDSQFFNLGSSNCQDKNEQGYCQEQFKWACDSSEHSSWFVPDCQKLCGKC